MTKKEQKKKAKKNAGAEAIIETEKPAGLKIERKKKTEREAGRRKFDFKSLVLGLLAFVALVVVIVAIVLLNNQPEEIPDFKTNDTQIVMTMNAEMASYEDSEYEPEITHIVYFHDGEKVTNVKAYYEYGTDAEAKEALPELSMDYFSGKRVAGRYVVLQVERDKFAGLTVAEIEKQYSLMKAAGLVTE